MRTVLKPRPHPRTRRTTSSITQISNEIANDPEHSVVGACDVAAAARPHPRRVRRFAGHEAAATCCCDVLRRAVGPALQVRGVHKMVEEDRYCAEVLVQLSSVQEALRGVATDVIGSRARP